MNALRLSILLILTYISLYSQEESVLVQTMPAKPSFPNHVIPLFRVQDFRNLVEKKLYQMAYDAINERIAENLYLVHRAIIASKGNIEFVKAILQHETVRKRYQEDQHIRGLLTAAGTGAWNIYDFLYTYICEAPIDYCSKYYDSRVCGNIVGLEEALAPCLISAVARGFFDFVYKELSWRERQFQKLEIQSREELDEKWSTKWDNHGWWWWHARALCDVNIQKETMLSGFGYCSSNGWISSKPPEGRKLHSLPLHTAVDYNKRDIVIVLLQYGADLSKQDCKKETPLTIARHKNYTDIEKLLTLFIRYRDLITQINTEINCHEYTGKLLKACPALASHCLKDTHGNSLLHHAVKANDIELITTLLEGDPLLALEANKYGFTPLECSFLDGKYEALKAILAFAHRT